MKPFRIAIPQSDLDDLKRRIGQTRWPTAIWHGADDWSWGTPAAYLKELVAYWRDGFDWRAAEARVNAFPQFVADVDGQPTHFIHARSPHAGATPLLLVHGWPGSVVEFLDVLPRLLEPEKFGGNPASACHIVCPSLPGFGFSPASPQAGMSPDRVAALHARLMELLGYERFVAQGGDWGAICCRHLPDICPQRLLGLHVNMIVPRPPQGLENPESVLTDDERAFLARWHAGQWEIAGYSHVQGTKPQTLAYGLSDSPVGLAGWITEKFHRWTDNRGDLRDAVSWDALLTNISVYWFGNSIGSSVRMYREYFDAMGRGRTHGARCTVPTGVAVYPREIWIQPRSWTEREFNVVHWFDAPRGGHFAALEQPKLFAEDLWRFVERVG